MKIPTAHNKTGHIFSLLIFCAFAIAVLLVLIFGASVYQRVGARNETAWDQRTALSYIEAKIRHHDAYDAIEIGPYLGYEELGEIDTLYLSQQIGERTYQTMIYLADGWIYELFCEKGLQFHPADGSKILQAQSLEFDYLTDSGLLQITCTDTNNRPLSLLLLPRCDSEVSI